MKKDIDENKDGYEKKRRRRIWHSFWILFFILAFYFTKVADNFPSKRDLNYIPGFFGVTFSTKFCSELGLNWKEVYLAILDDLQAKEIRIPIYWNEIETEKGVYDFSNYDYIIQEGAKRNVHFIANIGWRLPRWPECHAPEWAQTKSLAATQANALDMLGMVVDHYRNESSIVAWQIENEPFLNTFGVCPPSDENFFKQEVDLVRRKDNRPVMVSATGELSFWQKEAKYGDWFGSTVYRVVWGPYTKYFRYPIPAWFYRFKAYLAGIEPENRYIVELQAEPWVPHGSLIYLPEEEAKESFNIEQFKANLQYAINVRFKKAYLWGVEWWYYQYKNGDQSYWELVRTLFK